ncbi:hypothetical protein HAX54_005839 [Datura stramonium]|uniref:Uncharacterized protein n=1 Tax=Datura stramonium TaxID=4076 RepID=A0ABS8T9F3_DATST|nr:hypothetical protein [Datura stramonium]
MYIERGQVPVVPAIGSVFWIKFFAVSEWPSKPPGDPKQRLVSYKCLGGLTIALMILVDDAGRLFPLQTTLMKVSSKPQATKKVLLRTVKLFILGVFLQDSKQTPSVRRNEVCGKNKTTAIKTVRRKQCSDGRIRRHLSRDTSFSGGWNLNWFVVPDFAINSMFQTGSLKYRVLTCGITSFGIWIEYYSNCKNLSEELQDFNLSGGYYTPFFQHRTSLNCHSTCLALIGVMLGSQCVLGLRERERVKPHFTVKDYYILDLTLGHDIYFNRVALWECSVNSPDYGPLPSNAPGWCLAPFDPEGILIKYPLCPDMYWSLQVDVKCFRTPMILFQWMGMNALILYRVGCTCDLFPGALQGFYWYSPKNNLPANQKITEILIAWSFTVLVLHEVPDEASRSVRFRDPFAGRCCCWLIDCSHHQRFEIVAERTGSLFRLATRVTGHSMPVMYYYCCLPEDARGAYSPPASSNLPAGWTQLSQAAFCFPFCTMAQLNIAALKKPKMPLDFRFFF